MEINIQPATPAEDQAASVAFPTSGRDADAPASDVSVQGDEDAAGDVSMASSAGAVVGAAAAGSKGKGITASISTSSTSSSSTSVDTAVGGGGGGGASAATPIALSAKLSDIASAIDDVRGLLFTIQEQRHLKSFTTVSASQPVEKNNGGTGAHNHGHLSPPASSASSSQRGASASAAASAQASSELDRALIQLDTQLEHVSRAMVEAEGNVHVLMAKSSSVPSAASQEDDDAGPEHLREIARTRRDSRASLSSLASFDDVLLQTGASSAAYAPALTASQVQQRFLDLQADWLAVTTEADMLKRELSEDKYLLVFRSVSDQAENMMTSLQKAITLSQDFISAFRASQAQREQDRLPQTNSRLSLDGHDVAPPEAQLEELRALKKTFSVKTSYYGPACEQVFHVLERGIKDKATSNGTILHRYADLKMRWKTIREAILRTDRDLTKIERHLCKMLGLDVPPYSPAVVQHYGAAVTGGGGDTSPSRQRQGSLASGQVGASSSTPPRLQPKSSARTLRHMPSSQSSTTLGAAGDRSFSIASTASPSRSVASVGARSPPAPVKPPRSELRRLSSAQRVGDTSTGASGATAIPIPGTRQQGGGAARLPSQLSTSVGSGAPRSNPHRRSISASANEPLADLANRRSSVLLSSSYSAADRPSIPPRAGSRAGARTPLGGSTAASSRRAHSPTHPPSSYRLGGGAGPTLGSNMGAGIAPRRSKTPQPSSSSYSSATSSGGSYAGGIGGRAAVSRDRGTSEPPESMRPASRSSMIGRGPTGTIRSSRPPVSGGRSAASTSAYNDATADLSMESGSMYDGPPSPSSANTSTGGIALRQRPASSMAMYYQPPAAHGQQPTDTHIPRLAVNRRNDAGSSQYGGGGNAYSPATSLSSLPGRPGSSLSQASTSTTGRGRGVGVGVGGGFGGSNYYTGASRLTMQTPEPALAAQVKRLSLFARPAPGSSAYSIGGGAGVGGSGNGSVGGTPASARRSSRPPPARLNQSGRVGAGGGRTTPLSAAALAAVPQGNPALAWMRDVKGSAGGGIGPGSSPSHSFAGGGPNPASSSVAAFRAQRANAVATSTNGGAGSTRAETPLSESSFGGQSVGGWGVRPGRASTASTLQGGGAGTSRTVLGRMSSATGGAGGGAGSFDVYVPNARDALDVAVAQVVNALGVAIERVDEPLPRGVRADVAPGKDLQARYAVAGKTVQCKLLMLHRPAGAAGARASTNVKKLLVRVGGGWQDFEGWISASILGRLEY